MWKFFLATRPHRIGVSNLSFYVRARFSRGGVVTRLTTYPSRRACPKSASAARSPPWMQSGRPTPRKALPAIFKPGKQGQTGLDPGHALLVADVILGHRPRPMGDVAEYRLALDPQERPQMRQAPAARAGVGHFRQIGPPRPAHKDPQQRLPRRGPMRILLAAEAASQDRTVLDRRHHRPHAVQRDVPLAAGRSPARRSPCPSIRSAPIPPPVPASIGASSGLARCAGTATIRASNSKNCPLPAGQQPPDVAGCARSFRSASSDRIDSGGKRAVIASTSVLSPSDNVTNML